MKLAIETVDGDVRIVSTDYYGSYDNRSRCYSSDLRCIICDDPVYCREIKREVDITNSGDTEKTTVLEFFHEAIFGIPCKCELLPNLHDEIIKSLFFKYHPDITLSREGGRQLKINKGENFRKRILVIDSFISIRKITTNVNRKLAVGYILFSRVSAVFEKRISLYAGREIFSSVVDFEEELASEM